MKRSVQVGVALSKIELVKENAELRREKDEIVASWKDVVQDALLKKGEIYSLSNENAELRKVLDVAENTLRTINQVIDRWEANGHAMNELDSFRAWANEALAKIAEVKGKCPD